MPSNDEKSVSFPSQSKGKKDSKDKKPQKFGKSIGWFFGIAILVFICITFILPATLFTQDNSKIVFGKYDGKDIALSYDSYFYYQLQNVADYYADNFGGVVPTDAWPYVYLTAYQNAVVFEAISEMADKAGIIPSEQAISETILASGYWNNANGIFDTERYQSATEAEKASITSYAAMMVPFQIVTDDIYGVKVSDNELNFISSLSNETRDFEYYIIDNDDYADADAVTYAKNNPEPFAVAELTLLSYATKFEADEALERLTSGESTVEEEAANSIDNYAEVGGAMGPVPKYHLDAILASTEGASDEVFSTAVGSFAGPYSTDAGYSLFKVEASPSVPDFTDATTLASIKDYIETHDSAIMLAYIGGIAQDVYATAKEDFDAAGDKYNLTMYSVKSAAENPGGTDLILSMNYSDYMGYLAAACAADEEFSAKLFDAPVNEVFEPILTNNSTYVVVRPVASTAASEYMVELAKDLYSTSSGQYSLNDLESGVLLSDKFEDDFINTYYSQIVVSSETAEV